MTQRQFLAWQDWIDRTDDEPSLTDHYLMQVAKEVHTSVRPKSEVTIHTFRLRRPTPKTFEQDQEEQAQHEANVLAAAKSESLARKAAADKGIPVTYRVLTEEERIANLRRAGMLPPEDEPTPVAELE